MRVVWLVLLGIPLLASAGRSAAFEKRQDQRDDAAFKAFCTVAATGRGAVVDGFRPISPPLERRDGSLVGTAHRAGGEAILFAIDQKGALRVLHEFAKDAPPTGSLIEIEDGRVLGVTIDDRGPGGGAIYALAPDDRVTVLAEFDRYAAGGRPVAGLTEGSDGSIYGVADAAGVAGSVFRLTLDGALTVVHALAPNGTEGADPVGALVEFSDGSFYGVAAAGGAHWAGAVFRVSPEGETAVLHSFDPRTEGSAPAGGIMFGPHGSFFGVLQASAKPATSGAVYKVAADGTFAIVHHFDGRDGANPFGELVTVNDGSLLGSGLVVGVTRGGGPAGGGTIYRLDTRRGGVVVLRALAPGDVPPAGGLSCLALGTRMPFVPIPGAVPAPD